MGITAMLTTRMVTDVLLRFKEDQSNLLADAITQDVQNIMLTGNAELVDGLLADQAKLKGIKKFQIITVTGSMPFYDNKTIDLVEQKIGEHRFKRRHPKTPMVILPPDDPKLVQVLKTGRKSGYYEKVNGDEVYTQLIPLINEERCHLCHDPRDKIQGILGISIPVSDVMRHSQKLYWWLFSLSWALIGSLSFLLYLLLKRTIINPITMMNSNMAEIAQGNLDKRIEIYSTDEIGGMGRTFNLMARNMDSNLKELKKINQELKETEKANALNKISTLFTHDLQNPLVGIKKTIELLKNQGHNMEPEASHRIYDDLQATCELLLGMISEMLDVFHQNYEKLPLRLMKFNLNSIISETVRLLKIEVEQKGVILECICRPADLKITADQRRLQRVLVNLLSNAIKYTPPDKHIWLSAVQSQDSSEVVIQVEDEGTGIPESEMDKIFSQFCHIESGVARYGTGLGLYFCKTVVQEHGGKIRAENRPQGGARFSIVLPNQE